MDPEDKRRLIEFCSNERSILKMKFDTIASQCSTFPNNRKFILSAPYLSLSISCLSTVHDHDKWIKTLPVSDDA